MMEFRNATAEDVHTIRAFIADIVIEVYGHVINDIPATITKDELLAQSLLVFIGQRLVGVGLTVDDIVDDIWLSAGARGIGIGSEMLGRLEQQIVDRGFQTARLRVLEENNRARRFYENHGWIVGHSYQHERLGVNMVNYSKTLPNRS